MSAYLPTLHSLLGVPGLAATLRAVPAAWRHNHRPAHPAGDSDSLAGWGLACLVLTIWRVAHPDHAAHSARRAGCRSALLCLAHPRLRARIGPLGWCRTSAAAQPAAVADPAAATPIADRYLAQPVAQRRLPLRPQHVADRRAAPELLVPARRAVQHAVRGLHRLGGIRLVCRCRDGAVQCRAALRQRPAARPRHRRPNSETPSWSACAAVCCWPSRSIQASFRAPSSPPTGRHRSPSSAMFAVWLAVDVIIELAHGMAWPRATTALALVLTAMVNIKQSGIGALLSIGVTLLVLVLAHPRIPRRPRSPGHRGSPASRLAAGAHLASSSCCATSLWVNSNPCHLPTGTSSCCPRLSPACCT